MKNNSGIPPPFKHQTTSSDFQAANPVVFDMSDPGTGKTRAYLDGFIQRRKEGKSQRCLVIAPKSILEPAWVNDIRKFTPHLSCSVAYAKNRVKAFQTRADIYITNHDAVKWIEKNPWAINEITDIAVDESTAFKNPTSGRSKSLKKIIPTFPNRTLMTGTPMPNTVTDVWHQAFLLDKGERLGSSFWAFRASVCEPVQTGPATTMVQWRDKEGSPEAVAALLGDITVRNVFEDCIDIPANSVTDITFKLPQSLRAKYDELTRHSIIQLQSEDITAVNAAVLTGKLLQLSSGAVYNNNSATRVFNTERYELIIELINQRESCIVAYNWGHQLEQLRILADKAGIKYAIINGKITDADRNKAVDDFQEGRIKVIFAHPKSASHGLTLTRGTTTIWASPTFNAEHYAQFNRRIYRAGQKRKTETVHITAEDTLEPRVYEKLQGKLDNQTSLLNLLGD